MNYRSTAIPNMKVDTMQSLVEQHTAVMYACAALTRALGQARPDGRNYQMNGCADDLATDRSVVEAQLMEVNRVWSCHAVSANRLVGRR